jgi:hypothetical protein
MRAGSNRFGCLLLVVAFVFLVFALGWQHDHRFWGQWLGVAIPVAIVAAVLRRAWILGSQDGVRLRELAALKEEWQGKRPHLGRGSLNHFQGPNVLLSRQGKPEPTDSRAQAAAEGWTS